MAKAKKNPKNTKKKKKETGSQKARPVLFERGIGVVQRYDWALFIVLLVAGLAIVFQDFLGKELVFLFSDIGSDSLNVKYPRALMSQWVKENNIRFASWSHFLGMGSPIIPKDSSIWMVLSDWPERLLHVPGKWIGALLGYSQLPYSVLWRQIIDLSLSLIFLFLWARTLAFNNILSVLSALAIGFSGYLVISGTWLQSEFQYVFLLFAMEQLLVKRRWYFLPIAYMMLNSYEYWFGSMFFAIYGLVRFFQVQEKFSIASLAKFGGTVILLAAIGMALSYPKLKYQFEKLSTSPRGQTTLNSEKITGSAPELEKGLKSFPVFGMEESVHYQSALLRTFDPDLLGSGSEFSGWRNYLEAPVFSGSLLFLLVFPLVFFLKDRRSKITIGSLMAIWLIIVLFPFFRYAFCFFAGDYYRQGIDFFITASLVFSGAFVLNKLVQGSSLKWYHTVGATVLMLALLNMPFDTEAKVNKDVKLQVAAYLVVYGALVTAMTVKRLRYISLVLLVVVVPIELFARGKRFLDSREALSAEYFVGKKGYNDYSVEAIQFIKDRDSSFYRVEKNFGSSPSIHSSINDAQAQHFFGTQSYASFNNIYYIRFLARVGIIDPANEIQTRWAPGIRNQPLLHGPFGVKYTLMSPRFQINNRTLLNMQENGVPISILQRLVSLSQSRVMDQADFDYLIRRYLRPEEVQQYLGLVLNSAVISGPNYKGTTYTELTSIADVTVLENQAYMPFGTMYGDYLLESEYDQLSDLQKQTVFYDAVILPDSVDPRGMSKLPLESLEEQVTYADLELKAKNRALNHVDWDSWELSYTHGKGSIEVEKSGMLFMHFIYDENWQILVDGEPAPTVLTNFGFMGVFLSEGQHEIEIQIL